MKGSKPIQALKKKKLKNNNDGTVLNLKQGEWEGRGRVSLEAQEGEPQATKKGLGLSTPTTTSRRGLERTQRPQTRPGETLSETSLRELGKPAQV